MILVTSIVAIVVTKIQVNNAIDYKIINVLSWFTNLNWSSEFPLAPDPHHFSCFFTDIITTETMRILTNGPLALRRR
jgi:hypothetical protein